MKWLGTWALGEGGREWNSYKQNQDGGDVGSWELVIAARGGRRRTTLTLGSGSEKSLQSEGLLLFYSGRAGKLREMGRVVFFR